jgi:hypothetical protein
MQHDDPWEIINLQLRRRWLSPLGLKVNHLSLLFLKGVRKNQLNSGKNTI